MQASSTAIVNMSMLTTAYSYLFIVLLAVEHLGGHVGVGPRAPAQQLLVGAPPQLLIRAGLLRLLPSKRDQPKVLEVGGERQTVRVRVGW